MARGAIRVVSINGALTVTFTAASGATPTVFSDEACTSSTALPATVSDGAASTFYFASPGSYTLSVKTASGIQIAGDLNATKVVTVDSGDVGVYAYDARLVAKDFSGDSGRHSPNTDLSGTYQAIPVENAITADATLSSWNAYRVAAVSRQVTDAAVTAGSTTVTSATASFAAGDVASYAVGSHFPALATIASVTNSTTAVLSHMVALTGTNRTLTIIKPVTLTLPAGNAGEVIVVSKTNGKTSLVTIAPQGGGTINGAANVTLSAPRGVVVLSCTAANTWTATGDVDNMEQGAVTFRQFPKFRAYDSHSSPDANTDTQLVAKPFGSGDVAPWEAWHQDVQGDIVHFNCGPGMVGNANAAALLGLGCDYEGTGAYYHVRATGGGGIGLRVGMDQGLTWAGARGIQVTQGSGTGLGAEFIQSPGSTAPGPCVKVWAQIAADSGQKLMEWHRAKVGDTSVGVRVGYVTAQTGVLAWDAPVQLTTDAVGSVPVLVTGLAGQTANLQDWQVAGTGILASITKDGVVQGSFVRAQGSGTRLEVYNTGGTTNVRRWRISETSGYLLLGSRTDADATAKDALYLKHSDASVGLVGALPAQTNQGVGVVAIGNCTTVPTANLTGGGIMYSEAGALKWRGSGGTVTVLGAA